MDKRENSYRIDFIQEIEDIDVENHKITIFLRPDPRRYEWKFINGKRELYDKFDDFYFTEDCLKNTLQQISQTPMYFQPQKIKSADEYFSRRKDSIKEMIKTRKMDFTFTDKSEEFLESLSVNKLNFVILSIDIVGSTKLSTSIPQNDFAFLMGLLSFEFGNIIQLFNGYVLKYTGDGLIAYFPEPSFITMNDLAVDCAMTLRGILYKIINPLLRINDLPNIDIRIGLDAGEAIVQVIGNPSSKQHKDIIGSVISLAAKIQSIASIGEINLGNTVVRHLHVNWRQYCIEVPTGEEWKYNDKNGDKYKVFKLNLAV